MDSDCRIRFLPNPWPSDALPAPTCSLLTVAPTKGIVVGGAPEGLVVARTESVRQAIGANVGEGVKTKPFEPQAKIPLPARPMQVAFASGENALVASTEDGQQLLVYETSALLQSNAQPALRIPTNGAQLRALAPNPAPATDSNSELIAMVTTNGELLIANLKAGSVVPGPNGPVLKNNVSCVSWSNKGKQLVAGLADGTGYQMTPQGQKKDEIPRPPNLEGDRHSKLPQCIALKPGNDLTISSLFHLVA